MKKNILKENPLKKKLHDYTDKISDPEEPGKEHAEQALHGLNARLDMATEYMEVLLGWIILAGFILSVLPMLKDLPSMFMESDTETFIVFLERALSLVIGIEFIKMLVKHTPQSALDVLLYAIARHMVLNHEDAVENLIGMLAIALIFFISKFLIAKKETAWTRPHTETSDERQDF